MKTTKVILLLDMDSFFASCHTLSDKSLVGKPIAICGKGIRSIITSCNYKARDKGVRTGMPYYKAIQLEKDLVFLEPDFGLYTNVSKKVFSLIKKEFTNKVEIASIDECYIDATNIWKQYGSVSNLCVRIKNKIKNTIGVTASIGASYNKFFAKMVTSINKPDGYFILKGEDYKKILWPMDIEKMYGVGVSTAKILRENGISTIGDLANSSEEFCYKLLMKRGYILHAQANGYGSNEVAYKAIDNKVISNEITFDHDIADFDLLKDAIDMIINKVYSRLTIRNMYCKNVYLGIYTKNKNQLHFERGTFLVKNSKSRTISDYTNDIEKIKVEIFSILDEIYRNEPIRKISVGVTRLIKKENLNYQLTIDNINKEAEAHEDIDLKNLKTNINNLYRKNVVLFGDDINTNKYIKYNFAIGDKTHSYNKNIKKYLKGKK